MSTPLRIILIILAVLALLSGVHFVRRTFGVGPEFYVPIGWMTRLGIFPEELFMNPADQDTVSTAETPAPTQPTVFKAPVGAVMVVPLNLDDRSAEPADDRVEKEASTSGTLDAVDSRQATASAEKNRQPAQTVQIEKSADSYSDRLEFIKNIQPGGVILFGSNIDAITAKIAIDEVKTISPDTLIMVDHEGGAVQRLSGDGFTKLPNWRTLCAQSPENVEASVASAATELAQVGVDVIFGPVADLSGGFLGNRTCSADPVVIAKQSQIVIDIYAAQGIASVVKHFPGIGGINKDLHKTDALAPIRDKDLEPFSRILQANPELATMVSFVRVAEADEINPCAMSQYCLRELSKRFPLSLLIADALEMESAGFVEDATTTPSGEIVMVADGKATLSGRSIRALEAGINLLLYGPSVTTAELQRVVEDLQARYTTSNTMVVRFADAETRFNQWKEMQ